MSNLVEGRTALVTGAANGIGRCIVERFLVEGVEAVAAVDIEPLPFEHDRLLEIRTDLSETASSQHAARTALERLGHVEILVNCAGTFALAPAIDLIVDDYRHVIAVNLDAPVFLTQLLAPGMVERGYGRVVNITSIHGQITANGELAYEISKTGLNAATRSFAAELGPHGVLVNAVAPGFVLTRWAMVDGESCFDTEEFHSTYIDSGRLPLRRHADVSEIAACVAWLASEQNSYITGQVIVADGGLTLTL